MRTIPKSTFGSALTNTKSPNHMAQAARDENNVTTLLAVSSVDGVTPVTLYADPVTHRLLVSVSASNLSIDDFDADTIVTEAEGIGANDNDTTIPTSAAVKDYADSLSGIGGSTGATDNAILRADGVGGSTVQNSGITISDADAIDGVASLDIDANGSLTIDGTDIITDAAGTATLSNIDAIDATTEATIEAAIDTLSNLTTVGALDAGSITANFGAIDNGTSNITTGGILKIDVDGTAVNAAGSLTLGAGNDAGIYFDGTDLIIMTDGAGASGIIFDSEDDTIEFKGSGVLIATLSTSGLDLAASDALSFGGVNILADAAGTMTLSNIDALDATTESTIEAAIDTLANLTSIQGLTVTLADAGADAILGWDDTAGAYENLSQAEVLAIIGDAGLAAKGVVELATAAETTTGTDATRAVTPDGFAGSDFGIRYVQCVVFDFGTDVATGDGKFYFHIPAALDGMNLVEVHAEVVTAGTTNTTDVQIHNATDTADMLSTKLTIDSTETGSDTAATAAVIDGTADDVAENDVIRIDVDQVSTTAPKGLIVTLGFQLP